MKSFLSSKFAVVTVLSVFSFLSIGLQASDWDVSLELSSDGSSWVPVTPFLQSVSATQAYVRAVIEPTAGGASVSSNPIKFDFPASGGALEVNLESSTDLSGWQADTPGTFTITDKQFFRLKTIGYSLIPAGTFTMGSPVTELGREPVVPNETQHEVTLTRNFYMQQTEVTWDQWNEVRDWALANSYTGLSVGTNGVGGDASGTHPVAEVDWFSVLKWLNAKSEREGLTPCYTVGGVVFRTGSNIPICNFNADGYRLPTEAEWEYACRAGTSTAFYNGEISETGSSPVDPNLDLIGWYNGNSSGTTQPVTGKVPNAWKLFDMSGNLFEWCWDWYDGDLGSGSVTDPLGAPSSTFNQRVMRGGSWNVGAEFSRSAMRFFNIPNPSPNPQYNYVGFRPVRTVPAED
ncbi:formylglycine-generating enzyme family protein [Puniceicoccales bacterium CK1056]|uniref:Formylglycine-generating enzyme family protein n=1 Tax=Oceanipulchritudo coccoides TaxID=2706888 RepID=A0A6B2M4J8_9BACT|nr:formylglycine-generating enzyme family protein [Oceanipulchritudo coccoides]NDV63159.1 formylglycine-generating enzyme family protein [Oceanipulchritudo coccoides]